MDVGEIEVAGASAAQPCKIAQGNPRCAGSNQKQTQVSLRAVTADDACGNDDLAGGGTVEHGGLAAIEPPAFRRFLRGGIDPGQIEPRGALGMREREQERAVGNPRQHGLLLCLAAAGRDQARADHDGRQIGLGNKAAAKCFHQDAGLDGAAAKPAMGFVDRQRQPAEIGELPPNRGAEAERFVRHAATMIGGVGFRHEAVGTFP